MNDDTAAAERVYARSGRVAADPGAAELVRAIWRIKQNAVHAFLQGARDNGYSITGRMRATVAVDDLTTYPAGQRYVDVQVVAPVSCKKADDDTTDWQSAPMDPKLREYIQRLRAQIAELITDNDEAHGQLNPLKIRLAKAEAEIARLRAAEVPLSANVGFSYVGAEGDKLGTYGWQEGPIPTADDARDLADDATVVALIPLTAWDRA